MALSSADGRGQRGHRGGSTGGSTGGLTWAFLSAGELSTADRSAGRGSTSCRRRKKTVPLLGRGFFAPSPLSLSSLSPSWESSVNRFNLIEDSLARNINHATNGLQMTLIRALQ